MKTEYSKPKKKILKLQPKEIGLVNKNKTVPELKLSGIWLQSNGFHEGEQVEITYGHEYIVIYPYKS